MKVSFPRKTQIFVVILRTLNFLEDTVIEEESMLQVFSKHSAAQEVGEVWTGRYFWGAQSTKFQNYSIFEEFWRKKHGFSQLML